MTKKTEPIGLALTVQGEAFVVSENKTKSLETSDYIYDFSEIVTGENSQVTFKDNFDHKYHLAPGSHVKILNRMIELRSGYLWVKSEGSEKGFSIQTANAKVGYNEGEAIVTFDALAGKTQLLVIRGEMEFSNILLDENKVVVTDASFSFIAGGMENSVPRPPTGIGQASFSKVVSLFLGIKPEQGALALEHNSAHEKEVAKHGAEEIQPKKPERAIASVAAPEVEEKKGPGKFVYVKSPQIEEEKNLKLKKLESLYEQNLAVLEKNKPKKPKQAYTPEYNKKSSVTVKIYGQKKVPQNRLPASIESSSKTDSFEDLSRDLRQQNEAGDLIRQLNNFKSE